MTQFTFPSRLYPIVDTLGRGDRSYVAIAAAIVRAGAPFLQLRFKGGATADFIDIARQVQQVANTAGAQLIVNDRADVAKLIGAAGVHLGQDDLAPSAARAILGPGRVVGVSTHSLEQALTASRCAAVDYIGFGPIFATTSKQNPDPVRGVEGLRMVRANVDRPIVAIGGITTASAPEVLAAGADAVAMIGEVVGAADIEATVRRLLRL